MVPVAAYRAAVKVLNGPGCCLAALDLAREARLKLGDSAEVRKKHNTRQQTKPDRADGRCATRSVFGVGKYLGYCVLLTVAAR